MHERKPVPSPGLHRRPRAEAAPRPPAWPCCRSSLRSSKQPVLLQTASTVEGVPRPVRVPKGRRTESQSVPRVRLSRSWDKPPSWSSRCSGTRQRGSKDGSQDRGRGEAGKGHLRGERAPPAHAGQVGLLPASASPAGPGPSGRCLKISTMSVFSWKVWTSLSTNILRAFSHFLTSCGSTDTSPIGF